MSFDERCVHHVVVVLHRQVGVREDVRHGQGNVGRQRGQEQRGPDDEDLAPRFWLQLKMQTRQVVALSVRTPFHKFMLKDFFWGLY